MMKTGKIMRCQGIDKLDRQAVTVRNRLNVFCNRLRFKNDRLVSKPDLAVRKKH